MTLYYSLNHLQYYLQAFLESKGLRDIAITLSSDLPQSNKISGKFKHVIAL